MLAATFIVMLSSLTLAQPVSSKRIEVFIQKKFTVMRRTQPGFKSATVPKRKFENDMLEPAVDGLDVNLPPLFAEAHEQVCALIERCDKAGVPADTVLAALMAELMPRLVQAYGSSGVAMMLKRLASEISNTGDPPTALQ